LIRVAPRLSFAAKLSIAYAVLALAWILASDAALSLLVHDPKVAAVLGVYKGAGFVAVTALLLYLALTRRATAAGSYFPSPKLEARGFTIAIVLFCLALIGAIWTFNLSQTRFEYWQAVEREYADNSNLALALEEQTKSTLHNVDQTLRLIAHEYIRRGARLNIRKLIDDGLLSTNFLEVVSVVDENGRLVATSAEFKPATFADREYFQFHKNTTADNLLVGKPFVGRVVNRWVIPLSRRINRPDGSFGGVVYAALDPAYFNMLYEQANLGADGLIMLVGLDGVTRARRAGNVSSFGQDMRASSLFQQLAKNPSGTYASLATLGGVPRFISFRTLEQYRLVVAVGTAQAAALAPLDARARIYYAAGGLATAFILAFAAYLMTSLSKQRQAVDALYHSNARFGIAFNQAAVGIARADLDGRFLEINRKFCRTLGYGEDELLRRTFTDVTYPDDRRRARAYLERRLAEEQSGFPTLEQRCIRKDETVVWVTVTVALVHDLRRRPDYFMLVVQDITERKIAERLLADSERRFRALIENASDLVAIVDRNGVITYTSPALKAMGGYEAHEVLGKNFLEYIHPDDAHDTRAMFEELILEPGAARHSERRFRHKEGRWIVLDSVSKNALDDPTIQGIVVNARDITQRKHTEQALLRVNRALKSLSSCNGVLIRATDEMQLMQSMCNNIVEIGGYLLAWVGIVEHDDQKTVRPVAYAGYQKGFMEQARITWADTEDGRGPAGTAVRTRKLQVVQNALADPAFRLWQANAVRLGYGSVLAMPLISSDSVLGVLVIYSSETNAFDTAEMQLLGELADDLAYGMVTLRTRIAHEHSEKRLLRSMEGTILAMAATLEIRDAYTAGHQRRVSELSVAIARKMMLTEDEIHGIYLAAVVHDLGKIQIPAEILSKPTRLTRIEYELIKTHPEAGYNILKEVDFPWPIAQIVYQHHERLDGSGYPRGLKGDEILVGARILAIADTVEAMSSHRPYRAGLGIDKALEEITKNRAKIYDAAAVDACVKLFREQSFAFSS